MAGHNNGKNRRIVNGRELDLKKLSRTELLELLLEQTKELEATQAKVEELENQLADRRIRLEKAGNIAEAALQLNRIFEAAQKAADDYVLGVTGKPVTEAAEKAEDSVKSKGKDPEDSGRMEESDHKKAEDPSREPAKEAEDEKKPAYSERTLQEESRQQDPEEEDWDIQVPETELEELLPDSAEETQEKASMEIEYEDLRAKDS